MDSTETPAAAPPAATEPPANSRVILTSVVAALSLFAATAIGLLFELIIKSANPNEVDVTQGLAYLRPILIVTFVLVILAFVVSVLLILRLKKSHGAAVARLPWILLGTQIILWIVYVSTRAALGPIIDG